MMQQKPRLSLSRILWMVIGIICVIFAAIGAVLPIMPTTVFLIIAAYAFARSSPKLHAKLLNNKVFGPLIKDWEEHGAISRLSKFYAVGSMVFIVVVSIFLKLPIKLLIIQVLIISPVAYFILTRPLPPHVNKRP